MRFKRCFRKSRRLSLRVIVARHGASNVARLVSEASSQPLRLVPLAHSRTHSGQTESSEPPFAGGSEDSVCPKWGLL